MVVQEVEWAKDPRTVDVDQGRPTPGLGGTHQANLAHWFLKRPVGCLVGGKASAQQGDRPDQKLINSSMESTTNIPDYSGVIHLASKQIFFFWFWTPKCFIFRLLFSLNISLLSLLSDAVPDIQLCTQSYTDWSGDTVRCVHMGVLSNQKSWGDFTNSWATGNHFGLYMQQPVNSQHSLWLQ